ncbi:MAG: FAD-dependent oxidoreductase, partial [Casimicrobiaceae bacterium]
SFRDAVLKLAKEHPFARRLVNSGRLSVPATLAGSPLDTPDREAFAGLMVPGAPIADAPVRAEGCDGWFLGYTGNRFAVVHFSATGELTPEVLSGLRALARAAIPVAAVVVVQDGTKARTSHGILPAGASGPFAGISVLEDVLAMLAHRFDAHDGTTYLIRPDQHVCARWRCFDPACVRTAVARATCNA